MLLARPLRLLCARPAAPGRSEAPRACSRQAQWAPSHNLTRSSQPPPTPPSLAASGLAGTAANLNEFIERVFVSGIDPHGGDDEPAEGGGAAGAAAESGSGPTGPHVPPGLGARLAALRSAGELATMEAPPSELDCHALPQWVYLDGLEPGQPACQHVLTYESLEEDFAALIGMVDAATARAATATTLSAAAADDDGATAAAAAAATDADPNAKMREELERLKRMLRREESDVHDALQQTDKLGWEIDSSRPCNSTSGDKGAGSEAASTISTATSSTATISGASGEMYRSFNLSYARGELSRHGDVRGGCGISVSDLSSASRAVLTMAYAADFARLGYDPLDLGHRPRLQTSAADLGYGPLDRGADGGADRGADGRAPSEAAADAEEARLTLAFTPTRTPSPALIQTRILTRTRTLAIPYHP